MHKHCSLQPHVLGPNAKEAGQIKLYCSKWFKVSERGQRECWFSKPFPRDRFNELGVVHKRKYQDLTLAMKRYARPPSAGWTTHKPCSQRWKRKHVWMRAFRIQSYNLKGFTGALGHYVLFCSSSTRLQVCWYTRTQWSRLQPKKRRSVGTKKEPTCSVCHSRKHYGSSCPHLAQKLLKAVRKTTGLKNLVNAVSERRLLTVLEAKKKPRRTLKRRPRGNSAAFKKARQTGTKTRRTKKKAERPMQWETSVEHPEQEKNQGTVSNSFPKQVRLLSFAESQVAVEPTFVWMWRQAVSLWAQDCATAWCWQMFLQMHRVWRRRCCRHFL